MEKKAFFVKFRLQKQKLQSGKHYNTVKKLKNGKRLMKPASDHTFKILNHSKHTH